MFNKRLKKDVEMLKTHIKNTHTSINAILFPVLKENESFEDSFSDITNFNVMMKGPPNSPYEDGEFIFSVNISNNYPFAPPIIKCHTQIYHPNINNSHVCSETLQDGWSPTFGLIQLFMSLHAIMFTPNKHEIPVKNITDKDIESYEEFKIKANNKTNNKN